MTIIGAVDEIHLLVRKSDGEIYSRTPFKDDQQVEAPDAGKDLKTWRDAFLTKWGGSRVLDERGNDLPDADVNDTIIVTPVTMPDGERAFQIAERLPPDWDYPEPWQHHDDSDTPDESSITATDAG